jgi:pyruvate formate lyase activating enzyme
MAYARSENGVLQCELCPHRCRIEEEKHGICGVRSNRGGELALPLYGVLSAVSTDPIEKKPLYHFYPGSTIFSVGFYGCSFRCPFCQNFRIAHHVPDSGRSVPPEELVAHAAEEGAASIAYTYSEPLVHFEWVRDAAREAKRRGLRNVLVSNGFINPEPRDELLELLDAANIDLKAFNQKFYRTVVGGSLQPVLDFISAAAEKIHLEVTTLVIPGDTDSEEEILNMAGFLADIDSTIPYHLSCYFPAYEYNAPPTDPQTVFELAEKARSVLHYVYPGNVGLAETDTHCHSCGATLVHRQGYRVRMPGIENGACRSCGTPVPFPV